MSAEGVGGPNPFHALRHPAFARFALGTTLCGVAQFLGGLATPFLINQLTDSNSWVGAASFAALIPAVVGTPLSGTLADRMDRRLLLVIGMGLQTLVMAAVLFLYAADRLTPWLILALNFVGGSAASFQWAPIQSLAAILVPRESLAAAVRMVSITFTIGRSIGPVVAALTLAFGGPGWAFAVCLGLYLAGFLVLTTVRPGWAPTAGAGSFRQQFVDGIAYVRERPEMRLAFRLAFTVAAFGAVFAFSLAAGVADDLFGLGGGGLGVLSTTLGVGSLVASAYISGAGSRVSRSVMERRSILLYGAGLVLVAATPWMGVGMAGYLLMGMAHMLHGTTLSTALQMRVDERYRGRVMSVFLVAVLSGIPFGGLAFGVLADLVGLRWVALAAGLVLLVDGISLRRRGVLAMLDREAPTDGDESGADGAGGGPFADGPDSGDDRGDEGRPRSSGDGNGREGEHG